MHRLTDRRLRASVAIAVIATSPLIYCLIRIILER